jgi:hypothetical protein
MIYLARFRQEVSGRPDPDGVSVAWAVSRHHQPSKDRVGFLDLCFKAHLAEQFGKTMDVLAQWRMERAVTPDTASKFPWDEWSTDTDATQEDLRMTVSFSIFLRHLLNRMSPDVGSQTKIPLSQENILRIHFQ